MQTADVAQCLKIITRKGSEKIIRYAFELARREGRRKVTCATKANIMKLTEGLFKRVFEELSAEYPEIVAEHLIIDNVAHQMAKDPAQFDIIVTTNLNGDIISDLASGLVGGLGFAPSGNYGDDVAIFEAVHGSAPKYAGKDVINPTALILSSLMMLRHLDESDAADRIEDAVLVTLEEGRAVTQDLARQTGGDVERAASTTGFTDAIIANLGRQPTTVPPRHGSERPSGAARPRPRWTYGPERYAAMAEELVGADIFIESDDLPPVMGPRLESLAGDAFRLLFISSRGTVAYPGGSTASDHVRHFRCRFVAAHEGSKVTDADIRALLDRVAATYPSWNHVEKLRRYAGEDGFTKAQGQ
jgi:isocitrate dehydrogenase